jgi:hypothetical protein
VGDGVEDGKFRGVLEDDPSEPLAVDVHRARRKDLVAEVFDRRFPRRFPRSESRVTESVGIDDDRTTFGQQGSESGFTGADAPGQADEQQRVCA